LIPLDADKKANTG